MSPLFLFESMIKALLGMLARLPWGRGDMSGSMNGKHEGVSVKYASLIVFPLDKSIHYCMIVKDNRKGQVTHRIKQTNEYFLH